MADARCADGTNSGPAGGVTGGQRRGWTTRERAEFLGEASRRLGGSLSVRHAALTTLALTVPAVADWAQVMLLEPRSALLFARSAATRATEGPVVVESPRYSPPDDAVAPGVHTTHAPPRLHFRIDGRAGPRQEPGDPLDDAVPYARFRTAAADVGPSEVVVIPLVAHHRHRGTLVLLRARGEHGQLDEQSTVFDEDDLAVADELATRVAATLTAARLYEEQAHVASVLEASLRPPTLPQIPNARLASRYRTAIEHLGIGGDFYDAYGSGKDWLLVVGDVCGKGVEAAVLTGRSRQTIRTVAHLDRSPARILSVLNELLYETDNDRFVTAACARLRFESTAGRARLDVASAGHPAPIVLRGSGTVEPIAATGVLSGVFARTEYDETTIWLEQGDTVLLFTDGIYEAHGPTGFYGLGRLHTLLGSLVGTEQGVHPEVLCESVERSVVEHLAGSPHDDMALLALSWGQA